MIYKRAEPFLMRANSVKALGSSLSSRSKPPLKSTHIQRPKSLAPLGGIPPVFWNRAIASSRQVRGPARVRMGLEAVDNVGGGDLPKLSVLQQPTPHIAGQVNVPKRTSSSCGL
jgi:hypothetical protein